MTREDRTKYFKMKIPHNSDLIDITEALNDAFDLLDQRLGSLTEFAWGNTTSGGLLSVATSTKDIRTRHFQKTQVWNLHCTVTSVSSIIEVVIPTGTTTIVGEPNYQDSGFDSPGPFDHIGSGIALDTSAGLYYGVNVRPTLSGSNGRMELTTMAGSTVNATVPFTWASGDFLSFTVITQTVGNA